MRIRVAVLCCAALIGCGQRPTTQSTTTAEVSAPPAVDVNAIRDDLRKPMVEPDAIRIALDQLNNGPKATPLDPATLDAFRGKLQLTDGELTAIQNPQFGGIDAHLLANALFFRDAARTLDVTALPALDRATAALEWTVRHVAWEERAGPAFPPMFAALRGRGTTYERVGVTAMLCHALGIEAFAIGDPDAADDPAKLWGVAVLDGSDIRVLDARLGIALPGTLAGLVADAGPLKSLKDLGYDVDSARLKAARLYPMTASALLAPRWTQVAPLLPEGTRIGVDARQLLEQAGRLALSGFSPRATSAPGRWLAEFLPESEGGLDKPIPGQPRKMEQYVSTLLPWDSLPKSLQEIPPGTFGNAVRMTFATLTGADVRPGIAERLRRQQSLIESARQAISQEKESPTDPRLQQDLYRSLMPTGRGEDDESGPTLRQLLLRGQFSQATEALAVLKAQLRAKRSRSEVAGLGPTVDAWAGKIKQLLLDAANARPGDPAAMQQFDERAKALSQELPKVLGYVQYVGAGAALTRLDYLTAIAKHDQAEAKARRDRSPAAWQSAVQAWQVFLATHPASLEAPLARRLLADSLEGQGLKTQAAELYRQAAGAAKNKYDKLACSYLAELADRK